MKPSALLVSELSSQRSEADLKVELLHHAEHGQALRRIVGAGGLLGHLFLHVLHRVP